MIEVQCFHSRIFVTVCHSKNLSCNNVLARRKDTRKQYEQFSFFYGKRFRTLAILLQVHVVTLPILLLAVLKTTCVPGTQIFLYAEKNLLVCEFRNI